MKTGILTVVLLLCSGLFPASSVSAQTDTTTADSSQAAEEATESANPSSQEVEYNDENYRRFMELKDQTDQRRSLPTNTYQSATQKLDKLPESSQKHLRNQLREIILEEAEWAPGDENKEYPYVASEAAEKDPALRQQEQEAWGELVGKYHQREAQIYARANGKEAGGTEGGMNAAQANNAGPGSQPTGENAEGNGSKSGGSGDGEEQAQSGQQNQSANNANEGTYSPASSGANANDSDNVSNSGVSQSALQYLLSNKLGSAGSQGSPSTAETESSPDATGPPEQSISQQSNPEAAGLPQQQPAQQSDSRQQNPAQQAAEPGQFVVISKNTLSIKDLQNAQGISISVNGNSANNRPPNNEDRDPAQQADDDG